MKTTIAFLLLLTFNSHASNDCNAISEYQMKMNAHASNFKNVETTRTPEGGAYKYKKVMCQKTCRVVETESIIKKYLPNHPDADQAGYVNYPDINKEDEKTFVSTYAKSLVMISKTCPLEVNILEIQNGPSVLMKYHTGNITSDIINFEPNGSVISWVRHTKNGESKIVNL